MRRTRRMAWPLLSMLVGTLALMGCSTICYRGENAADSPRSEGVPCKFRLSGYTFSVVPELEPKNLNAKSATYYNTSVPAAIGNTSRSKVEEALVANYPAFFTKAEEALPVNVDVVFTKNQLDEPSVFVGLLLSIDGILPIKVADARDVCEVRVLLDGQPANAINPSVMRFSCKYWLSVWTPSAWLMRDARADQEGCVREWRGMLPPYRDLQTDVYLRTLASAVAAGIRKFDSNEISRRILLKAVRE